MSESIIVVALNTRNQCSKFLSSARKGNARAKVVNFYFSSSFFLPASSSRQLCRLMDFMFIQNFSLAFICFVMIAVCCQTHKNLNCSIKSLPMMRRAWKGIKTVEHQTVLTLPLIQCWRQRNISEETDWKLRSTFLFWTLQKAGQKFNKWIFNCTTLQRNARRNFSKEKS